MKKSVEFGLIVALSVMTVLATMTVLHDASTKQGSPLDQWIQRGVKAVFGRDIQDAKPAAQAEPKTSSPNAVRATELQSTGDASQPSGAGSWNQQDIARLQDIVVRLLQSISAEEWKTLVNAAADSNPQVRSDAVVNVLRRHLTDADQRWIAEHFSGRQAFDGEDVQLLQRMYSEVMAELTPDEQSILKEQLANLITTGSALNK